MTNRLHRLRTATLAISLSLCWIWAQPGFAGETAASGHETKPLIMESEYAKWRASLPDDYPQLADYRRMLLFWVVGAEQYWLEDPAHPKLGKCRRKGCDSSKHKGLWQGSRPGAVLLSSKPIKISVVFT